MEQYQRFAVMLDNFGHDVNGNPIARHTVFAYKEKDTAITNPSAELYVTRQRKQIGYNDKRDCYAGTALQKAGVFGAKFVRREGDRSNGVIYLIYVRE